MMVTRGNSSIALALLLLLIAGIGTAPAQELVFETDDVRLVVDQSGACRSLQEKQSRRELLVGSPAPLLSIRQSGKWKPITKLEREGDIFGAEFGVQDLSADLRIKSDGGRILFEVVQVKGAGVEEVRMVQLKVGGLANLGTLFSVMGDEKFAVGLIGLSHRVNARLEGDVLLASVYPEFGMAGEKVVLLAVPKKSYTDAVQRIEKDFKLPSPTIGGVWAKHAPDTRTSYLFTDLTEANADDTIRYAKLAGFKYILIYSHIWSSSLGSYQVNIRNYPRGEASLKAVIDKCHAAGLKVGMHMMTSFVDKQDAFARSRTQHLFSDAEQVLARDISSTDHEIPALGNLSQFLKGAYGVSKDVRIDDEIIRCETIGSPGATVLLQCVRGAAATKPASHKAGAKLSHLAEYYGSYIADMKSPLKDDIAESIAGVIDRCGFDMIYFDGAEVNCINGPCWHWIGQQELSVIKKVKRDLLIEKSGVSQWSWHIATRGTCGDFAAVASKQHLDYYKIDHWWNFYSKSFMPVELGWWAFQSSAVDHRATMPDEVEQFAVRMLALNAPGSIETTFDVLRSNGRTDEMLKLMGEYESLRLSDAVPEQIRKKLLTGEWRLENKNDRPQFIPVKYQLARPDGSGEILVRNEFAPQRLKFRLQAGPRLANTGDRSNITLLGRESPMVIGPTRMGAVSPGSLAGRILFGQGGGGQAWMMGANMVNGGRPPDLSRHRALAVKLIVEGAMPAGGKPGAVLNIQLESGGFYREHYLDLDFNGERTIIIPESNSERMLPELRPAFTTYSIKSAMYGFNYKSIDAVNIRWMRQQLGKPVKCTVMLIEALREEDSVLKNPELTMGQLRSVIPVTLRSGDYVEYFGDGPARVYDQDGRQRTTAEIKEVPMLGAGDNRIVLRTSGDASVKFTTMLKGDSLSW